jgi:5-deoxy-glucuronate isomerase
MNKFYKYEDKKGYHEIVDDKSGLDIIRFGIIKLGHSESVNLLSGDYEIGLVLLSGKCDIECDGKTFKDLSRKDVFSEKPVAVYIPLNSRYSIKAENVNGCEIAVCKVKTSKRFQPFLISKEDVVGVHRGQLNWQRDVNDIITYKYEGKVDKIVLGETLSCSGQWSSYPPHKHDKDNMPFETNMEEVYHFKVNPSQGFGVQILYNDDLSIDECYSIRNGDSAAIKEGYHPVASAPGYQVYYLWVMAGFNGRMLTPCDDPKHSWIKSVETMIK